MLHTIEQFLFKYPNFTQTTEKLNFFTGNVKISDSYYRIDLDLPNFPKLQNFHYKITKGLKEFELVAPKLNYEKLDLHVFLEQLPDFLAINSKKNDNSKQLNEITNKYEILKQISSLKTLTNCKIYTNPLMNRIKFDSFDNYDGHYLELDITNTSKIEILEHSLPEINSQQLDETENLLFTSTTTTTILGYYNQFMKLLQLFQDFYENLNAIDQLCFICTPLPITTKHNWRLFKLNDNKCFIKISVNPFCVSSVQINLYGPTNRIRKYRELYNENASKWDTEIDVYNNLLKIFDLMYFPMKVNNYDDDNDEAMECDDESKEICNICLCYSLDGQIPICSCDNDKCSLVFHVICLKKWFANSVEGKSFLTVTMGNCPFCKQKLSASFQNLLDDI